MNCVYLLEARDINDFKIFLRFNTRESGKVDLKETIFKYESSLKTTNYTNFTNQNRSKFNKNK